MINVPVNVPNVLSVYRLFSFPFVMIFVFIGEKDLFAFFICFNLITDFADGWIARRFNQVTEIGSIIDSMADTGLYILAFAGIIAFKWSDFQPHLFSFLVFMILFVLGDLTALIKFGRFHGYHTYSAKIGGYIKAVFFFVLFAIRFYDWIYYIVIVTGILAFIESIVITIILQESKSDVKGLYWILKERKSIINL